MTMGSVTAILIGSMTVSWAISLKVTPLAALASLMGWPLRRARRRRISLPYVSGIATPKSKAGRVMMRVIQSVQRQPPKAKRKPVTRGPDHSKLVSVQEDIWSYNGVLTTCGTKKRRKRQAGIVGDGVVRRPHIRICPLDQNQSGSTKETCEESADRQSRQRLRE